MPLAVYSLALAVLVMGTSEFMLAGLVPALAADLDVTVGTAGLLTSGFAVGMVIGAPLMAAFARRWPPRTTLLICLLAFAACHALGALTSDFFVLTLTRVGSALSNAGFLAVALSTATSVVGPDRKGRALATLLSGTTIAMVAGVPAGALLGDVAGWRVTFWAVAALCLPAGVGVWAGVPAQRGAISQAPSLRAEVSLLRSGRLLLAMSLGALVNGGTFAVLTFLAPVVTDVAGLRGEWIAGALVMFGVGSFLGVAASGRLADKRPGPVLAVGGPLLLVGWFGLVASASHPPLLLAMVLLQGLLAFGVGSTLIAQVLYAAADAPRMNGSYATAALNLGAVVGPALGAAAMSAGGGALAPVGVAVVLTAVALAMMVTWRRTLLGVPGAPSS
ncbi:Cmx/CmrA family chloramphenicol efflux MFS transporter [Microbacterium gorillae]|uniref:Cmx/CmrA family chloramphenicol efflux MFS transporter n=1 Tax=Microbacterium gorillae TaxID=1231063 RepID=UPI000590BCCE|nr:Cmx/CmrA family chloramphenicol efflux MFS transporter [Microbacterium gorillae]